MVGTSSVRGGGIAAPTQPERPAASQVPAEASVRGPAPTGGGTGQVEPLRADRAQAWAAQGQALSLAALEKGLAEVAAKLPLATGRTDRARLGSRLKQITDQLARIDPRAVDPAAAGRIRALLEGLGADGGKDDRRALLDRLRGWLSPEAGGAAAGGVASVGGAKPSAAASALKTHIYAAAEAYGRGDYAEAHRRLTDKTFAESLGLSLNPQHLLLRSDPASWAQEDLDSVVMQARMSSMSWDTGKIDIVDAGLFQMKGEQVRSASLPEMPVLARQLLPIMLEEWMHQLQRLTGEPVSQLSRAYCQAKGLEWSSALHELDIQAAFREWGYPVEALGTVHAYPERGEFEAWYRARGSP